jgi:hypothetical protein
MSYTQRTVDYIISRAYIHAQRKATPPATGTDKYNVLVGIIDSVQKDWADEDGIEWDSLSSKVTNGTVSATDTFDLDDEINYISKRQDNPVLLVSPDGTQKVPVKLVAPHQLYKYRNELAVAQQGRTLVFSKPFLSTDSTIGYSIVIPAIGYVDDLTSGSSLIQCDDPMFMIYMTAAEFDRQDIVKMGQYNNLLAMAAQKMEKMKSNNSGSIEEIPLDFVVTGESWA